MKDWHFTHASEIADWECRIHHLHQLASDWKLTALADEILFTGFLLTNYIRMLYPDILSRTLPQLHRMEELENQLRELALRLCEARRRQGFYVPDISCLDDPTSHPGS